MRMNNSFIRTARVAVVIGLAGSLVLSLGGCGTEDKSDTTPPDHIINLPKSQGKYLYGAADTITVDFGEAIDTAALGVAFSDSAGITRAFRGADKMLVFGKLNQHGQNHFPINLNFTMTMAGLRDPAGNGLPAIIESFQPYAWVDSDFFSQTYDGFDSLFASGGHWVDGSSMQADSFVTEGSLDFKRLPGEPADIDDYKLLSLVGSDTVLARLSTRPDVDLKIEAFGPFRADTVLAPATLAAQLDSAIFSGRTGTTGTLEIRFAADERVHKRKFGSFDAPGLYVLRLTLPQDKEGFYRLGLRILKFH